jgi:hypothetical protein
MCQKLLQVDLRLSNYNFQNLTCLVSVTVYVTDAPVPCVAVPDCVFKTTVLNKPSVKFVVQLVPKFVQLLSTQKLLLDDYL